MEIIYAILFFLLFRQQPEETVIGRMTITVNSNTGQTYYDTQINLKYFNNRCDLFSFIIAEAALTCNPEEVAAYLEYYLSTVKEFSPDTTLGKRKIY